MAARGEEGFWVADLAQRPEEAQGELRGLLDLAARLTRSEPGRLLAATGFSLSDPRGRRLDDALAELSAVCFLVAAGFTDVQALAAGDKKSADLLAQRGGLRYVFDVRCASRPLESSGRFAGEGLPYPTLADYAALLGREKRAQLEATLAAHHGDQGGLLVAVRPADGGLTVPRGLEPPAGLLLGVFSPAGEGFFLPGLG